MGLRTIVKRNDPILRGIAKPVTVFNERLWKLLDDMAETMREADGAGLAAPQISVRKRVIIADAGEGLVELINPEIISAEGEQEAEEGCLSIDGVRGIVIRPSFIHVRAQDRKGKTFDIEGSEFLPIVLSHEIDHLNGILFTDKMIREVKSGEDDD